MSVKGEDHGIHGILVRIRDDDMNVMPNVRVEDMGHKIGKEICYLNFNGSTTQRRIIRELVGKSAFEYTYCRDNVTYSFS